MPVRNVQPPSPGSQAATPPCSSKRAPPLRRAQLPLPRGSASIFLPRRGCHAPSTSSLPFPPAGAATSSIPFPPTSAAAPYSLPSHRLAPLPCCLSPHRQITDERQHGGSHVTWRCNARRRLLRSLVPFPSPRGSRPPRPLPSRSSSSSLH
jgi:hypothetical protein